MEQLTDKILETIVSEAIQKQMPSIVVPSDVDFNDVCKTIRVYMRQHPEVFWFSHQYRLDEATHILYFKYNFTPQKKAFYAGEIEKAVEYLFQPDKLKHLSDLEKVAYVYKWIINNTTYNEYSSLNQTIYSVLINRNSVCTGYAKTAQYLLGMIGVQSELVFGKFHADKSDGGRHGWNIVKIDGNWYHVDFCLAEPALKHLLNSDETPIEHDGLLWNYFCKPTEFVLKNRNIEFVDLYPECVKSLDKQFTIKLAKAQERTIVCKSNSGTSAKVYIDSFNKDSVIKKTRNNPHLRDNEVIILQCLKGYKHIVELKGRTDDGIVLEQLIPWSELLNSHYYCPNEAQLKDILIQLAEGLIECHDNGVTYSDIHYNNVFVSKDGTYKWGDFGIAFSSTTDGHLPSQIIGADGVALGSRWFMAPETYRDGIFTESSAIYSLAMLAYFVMNDMRPPFWNENEKETHILNKRLSGTIIELPINHSKFGDLPNVVCSILNNNLDARIETFDEFIGLLSQEPIIYVDSTNEVVSVDLYEGYIIDDNNNGSFSDDCMAIYCNDDADLFATTAIGTIDQKTISQQSNSFSQWREGLTHDKDSFARTCGFGPIESPMPQRTLHELKYAPGSSTPSPKQQEDSVSYSPSKSRSVVQANDYASKSAPRYSKGIIGRIGGLINGIVNSIFEFASVANDAAPQKNKSEISACVYAPAEVRTQKSFIIRVYMYKPEEQNTIDSKIKEIDPKAVKKEYKPLDIPVNIGDKLTVQLNLSDGVFCKDTVKTVLWRGHYTDCSFSAKLIDELQESIDGTAHIFINDVPAGEMLFTIDVVESEPTERYAKIDARRFSKIFISYAHQDENQVRGIAEGCRMLGKDYFFDRHSLQAGDIFRDKILNYIDRADLFVLCWSKNAAESEWVKIEREHALQLIREGKSSLSIYPLCLRPEAPLPLDMVNKYNFGTL